MRKWLPLVVVLAQVGALGFMAGEREWVARTGTQIFLRTAPIDPRDPMRGDYVRLDYEVSRVPRSLCSGGVVAWFDEGLTNRRQVRDRRVYSTLRLDGEGVATVAALSDEKPTEGLFLRGRVDNVIGDIVNVRYGVEAFFMQQGTARAFEDEMRNEKPGVPVNAEVAVGGNGLAVLTGYRWEPLGITFELAWSETAADGGGERVERRLSGITVRLKNHSDAAVAVVDRAEGGSFRLVRNDRWESGQYRWIGENAGPAAPAPDDVVVLEPGEVHQTFIDLTDPAWFVTRVEPEGDDNPMALGELARNWGESFRIEYVPPGAVESRGLPHADMIRHAELRSRAFSPAGGID